MYPQEISPCNIHREQVNVIIKYLKPLVHRCHSPAPIIKILTELADFVYPGSYHNDMNVDKERAHKNICTSGVNFSSSYISFFPVYCYTFFQTVTIVNPCIRNGFRFVLMTKSLSSQ